MKKIAVLLALCATLGGSAGFAAQPNNMSNKMPPCKSNQEFAWGTCLGALAVIGVAVGLTAACASGHSK